MEKLLQETPAKVLSLLAIAMTSLGMLMCVSLTNASFNGLENPLPQPPVSADKAMAMLDRAANSYSNFIHENLTGPATEAVAYNVQSAKDAFNDATDALAMYMPVSSPAPQPAVAQTAPAAPRVAGAYTNIPSRSATGGLLDAILAIVR